VPYFICPNCKDRSIDNDRRHGLTHQPVACMRCGFGFLFELAEDYYPSPNAGLLACDRDGRILAAGRGVLELTGYREPELMGREIVSALGLESEAEQHPVALALEWGVRRPREELRLRTKAGLVKRVVADIFPAYDDDGGLLVALAPA
jgi:PAS domain S-box-containing protein